MGKIIERVRERQQKASRTQIESMQRAFRLIDLQSRLREVLTPEACETVLVTRTTPLPGAPPGTTAPPAWPRAPQR